MLTTLSGLTKSLFIREFADKDTAEAIMERVELLLIKTGLANLNSQDIKGIRKNVSNLKLKSRFPQAATYLNDMLRSDCKSNPKEVTGAKLKKGDVVSRSNYC